MLAMEKVLEDHVVQPSLHSFQKQLKFREVKRFPKNTEGVGGSFEVGQSANISIKVCRH